MARGGGAVECQTIPQTSTNYPSGTSVTLDQFDTSLGALTNVSLSLSATMIQTIRM